MTLSSTHQQQPDAIIIGSGMGGLTAAAMLAADGRRPLVLEAAHTPGGCSSSYYRKGYIFESGATTLIGFDRHQPLRLLEEKTGIRIPRQEISPSMAVHINGETITRYKEVGRWIEEASRVFGEPGPQERFWQLSKRVADVVWKVSGRNPFFPPRTAADWLRLLRNDPRDVWVLPYALRSTRDVAVAKGITNPAFFRFLDEQLMISSQAPSSETPFLFGAPAITYTNYSNFTVPGGLIEMVNELVRFIESKGGAVHTKERVEAVKRMADGYRVTTSKGKEYESDIVVSNIPVWNLPEITDGEMKAWFETEAARYSRAWGAITLGVVTDDLYPDGMPLHHQLHLTDHEKAGLMNSDSIFVSFSARGDTQRAPAGRRVLNISTHAEPEPWFALNGRYDEEKEAVQAAILGLLRDKLPGFREADVQLAFSATPVTWSNWVNRKKGRVGGIPQSMNRSLLDWTPASPPFVGFYLTGDTVYPGQGIPGVTLSGINVYYRIRKDHKKRTLT
ncbi:MAG: phytoene desaturase family protein [Balneolaceae bacterium]